jgi:hypothetical protein
MFVHILPFFIFFFVIGGNKKDGEWNAPNNWGDQRDPRDIRAHGDMRQMIDPREHMRNNSIDHRYNSQYILGFVPSHHKFT